MQQPSTPPDIGNADRSGGILATALLALVVVIIFISLRFVTRIWLVKRVGWDDWCIVFAGFGQIIGMGLVAARIHYGFGRPAYYLTEHQFQEFGKYTYGEWLQTFATLTFTKISICLALLRITVTKGFIRLLYVAIAILAVSNIVLSLLWILQCTPHLDKAWNSQLPGKCFPRKQSAQIILSQAIISIISDYFLSAFPILILCRVQISFRSKLGLCLLMGLGVITGSLSIVRTILNYQDLKDDPTWLSVPKWYFRTWEILFGVVAACIPTLRPGYKWLVKKLQSHRWHISPLFRPSFYMRWITGGRRKSSEGEAGGGRSTGKWTQSSKPVPRPPSKTHSRENSDTSTLEEEDILPLQNFDEGVPARERPGYIHGELCTSPPSRLQRWDSEARIGAVRGWEEEAEDRI